MKPQRGWILRLKEAGKLARREIREGRFQRSMAVLAGCGAVISGFEAWSQHLRGAFSHRLMWTPIILTPPLVTAAAGSILSRRTARTLLPGISIGWLAAGAVGSFYHVRGIRRLPGGFRLGWYNLTIGPPIFAPLLLTSVGVMGLLAGYARPEIPVDQTRTRAEGKRENPPGEENAGSASDVSQGRFQRRMAAITAGFAALTGGEAYYEHLRGSFNKESMWTPVIVAPAVAAAGLASVESEGTARTLLPWTSGAAVAGGMAGALFHFQGIRRMPGGLSNLKFNFTMGPPLFAPLLLTMVGLLGLTASILRRRG